MQHVSLEESAIMGGNEDVDLPALDDTMTTLARIDPRKVQVVEVRFFGGLSVEETAEGAQSILCHGEARLEGAAKAWLYRELSGRTTMDSQRWKQVEALLQAVLDLPAENSEAFRRNACTGDEALEREVLCLLTSERQAGRFLEHPAIGGVVPREQGEPGQDRADSLIGQRFSHYRTVAAAFAGLPQA